MICEFCILLLEGQLFCVCVGEPAKQQYDCYLFDNCSNSNEFTKMIFRPELLVFSNIICSLCTCSFNNHIGMISEIANNILTNIGCSHCANNIVKTAVTAIIQVMLMK